MRLPGHAGIARSGGLSGLAGSSRRSHNGGSFDGLRPSKKA